jgi:hypothetical protein
LLNFIEIITYFFQYQREQIVNKETGEIFILTHPNDIQLAFTLLKPTLFKRADELSTTARNFYNWLIEQLQNTKEFTALDIRKIKTIHPRTLARHLQELVFFNYIQICGGNKHRGGFIYKLTNLDNNNSLQCNIERDLQATLKNIWSNYNNVEIKIDVDKVDVKIFDEVIKVDEVKSIEPKKIIKRKRIEDKEKHTLQIVLELNAKENGKPFLTEDITLITGRSYTTEARYLKTLWEENKLNRFWQNRQYYYTVASHTHNTDALNTHNTGVTTSSETVSQKPLSNSKSITV